MDATKTTEDKLMEVALEAGADDIQMVGDCFAITCDPSNYSDVQAALTAARIPFASTEITQVAKIPMEADLETQKKLVKLMDLLDDHDDVQNVYANLNITVEAAGEL